MLPESREHAALANVTNVEDSLFSDALSGQRLLKKPWWLEDVFFGQDPRTPMHAQCLCALGVGEDVDAVEGIGVHRRHDKPRFVRANGDQAEIEWSTELADLFKGRACRKILVLCAIVIFSLGQTRHSAVASVAG